VQNSTPPLFKQGIPALAKLVVCLLIGSALMVVDFQVKSLDFIRNQVSYVLRPLENIMLLPSDLFSFGEDYFTSRSSLEKENLSLKTRQTELSLLANQAALLAVENQNLRNLLELQKNTNFRTVPVEILFNPPNPISQRVVINRGSNHGILLSSGVDGIYPPGFAVAVITKIERNAEQNASNVFCSPIAEVNRHLQALALIYDPQWDAKPGSNSGVPSSTGRRQTRPKGQP